MNKWTFLTVFNLAIIIITGYTINIAKDPNHIMFLLFLIFFDMFFVLLS